MVELFGRAQRMAYVHIAVALHRGNTMSADRKWPGPAFSSTPRIAGIFTESIADARAAAEERMRQLNYEGPPEDMAAALAEAWVWKTGSAVATETLANLIEHYRDEYGLIIDAATGRVTVDPEIDPTWLDTNNRRFAALNRAVSAEKFARTTIEATSTPHTARSEVLAAFARWRESFDPFADQRERQRSQDKRDQIASAMQRADLSAETRNKVLFVFAYFSGWRQEEFDLQSSPVLIDPGEEVKGRVDALRAAAEIAWTSQQSEKQFAVLSTTDRQLLSASPASPWPDHVNRDLLQQILNEHARTVRAAQIHATVLARDPDQAVGEGAERIIDQLEAQRRAILALVDHGQGLDGIERDMIRCLLDEAANGDAELPALVLVDERSKKAADEAARYGTAQRAAIATDAQILRTLDAAGVGIRDVTNTAVEPIRWSIESTETSIDALAHRWIKDSDAARETCWREVAELDRRLFASGLSDDDRSHIRETLSQAVDFAYRHAQDGDERSRWFDKRVTRVVTDRDRVTAVAQQSTKDDNPLPAISAGSSGFTTTIEAALPNGPTLPWPNQAITAGPTPPQAPQMDTGHTL
ncbi:hypothetical protein ACIHDR_46055 [Nocardia sp. NPDC052278]|uniref:hypothetical protein n=1 Tax=unclassified Nocardia TaxID=2637762 RepID=UPI0036AB528B